MTIEIPRLPRSYLALAIGTLTLRFGKVLRPLLGGELLPRYVLEWIGEGLKHGAAPSVGV